MTEAGNFYWLIIKVRKCCWFVEQLTRSGNLVREYQLPLWRGSVISPVITQPSDPIRLWLEMCRAMLVSKIISIHFTVLGFLSLIFHYGNPGGTLLHLMTPDGTASDQTRDRREWSWSYLSQISSISFPVRQIVYLRFTLYSSSPVLTPEVCILISGRIRPEISVIDMKRTLSHVCGRVQRPCR